MFIIKVELDFQQPREVENMMVKCFPEHFGSYKVYETVDSVLKKNFRPQELDKIMNEMKLADAKPDDFVRKLALVMRGHTQTTKASNIILDIKEKLRKLIEVKLEPKVVELTRSGSQQFKVYVENKTDALLKFRVGLKQLDHVYTAVIFDQVRNYALPELFKAQIIQPGKMHVFKFTIKAEVFNVQDIYELKKNKRLTINLGVQADAVGIEGMRTEVQKVAVDFVKVRI